MLSISLVTLLLWVYSVYGQNEFDDSLQIPIIKKCTCDALTIKTEKGCTSLNYTQQVSLWNDIAEEDIPIDLSLYLSSVIVQPLIECPSGSKKEQYELDHAFISLQDGKIIYQGFKSEHYCIEFIHTADEKVEQMIQICTENFQLRTCCEINETVNDSGVCSINEDIRMDMLSVQWLNKFNRYIKGASCPSEPLTIEHLLELNDESDLRQLVADYEISTSDQYCVNQYNDGYHIQLGIISCNPPPVMRIPICCSMHEVLMLEEPFAMECLPSTEHYQFPEEISLPQQRIMWHSVKLDCSDFQILDFMYSDAHNFSSDGDLITPAGTILSFNKYCLGAVNHNNETYHTGLVCTHDSTPMSCQWRYDVQSVCLAISSFFIILTLVVYLGISDLRRRIGGVCLICELISLLIAQITLIIMFNKEEWTEEGCLTAGSIELIFVLASFFWLNVMCFDVWSTFRVFRSFSEKVFNIRIFVKYSLYAWGLPLMVTIVGIIGQKMQMQYNLNFTPEIGCFFTNHGENSKKVHWIYLYGPIVVLLLANTVFFVHLAMTLLSAQIERRRLVFRSNAKSSSVSNPNCPNVEDVKLYAKLFVIMGLPWLLELFTSFASKEILCYIWFLDLFNSLRGILIFVIFVCKRNIRDKIAKTWFPSFGSEIDSSSERSRKTSAISMTSWLPSMRTRKISTSANHNSEVTMGQLKRDN